MNSKHPKTIQVPPFCCDCSNFIDTTKPDDAPRCKVADMLDLVTGKKFYPLCQDMRRETAPCSTMAKLFKPKDDLDKTEISAAPSVEADKTNLN